MAGLLAASFVAGAVPASVGAFVLPSDAHVGAGSEWVYDSNFGETHVRMLAREDVRPDLGRYTWEMQVAGLRYTEDLELSPTTLTVRTRRLSGLGIIDQRFDFADPELVLELPLVVENGWEWEGQVEYAGRSANARARGEIVGIERITVPAGSFDTYHIVLVRTDDFGNSQHIDLWFDPAVGPIRAIGDLRWRGFIGFVQDFIGLGRFAVELVSYAIQPPEQEVARASTARARARARTRARTRASQDVFPLRLTRHVRERPPLGSVKPSLADPDDLSDRSAVSYALSGEWPDSLDPCARRARTWGHFSVRRRQDPARRTTGSGALSI